MEEHPEPKVTSNKTYIGGAFLFSEDGYQYEEKHKEQKEYVEKVVEDKIGISQLKQ